MAEPKNETYQAPGLQFPIYPEVEIKLYRYDGNAFSVTAAVSRAMKKANLGRNAVKAFQREAIRDDCDHVPQTVMRTVNAS